MVEVTPTLSQPPFARHGSLGAVPVRTAVVSLLLALGPVLPGHQWPVDPKQTTNGLVWASDGGGGDSGGDSSGDGGEGDGGEGDGGDGDEGSADADEAHDEEGEEEEDEPPLLLGPASDGGSGEFRPDELLALNPSPESLARAHLQYGVEVLETLTLPALGLQVVRLRLHDVLAPQALAELDRQDPSVFDLHHLYALAQSSAPDPTPNANAPVKQQIGWPSASAHCGRGQVIGMVDTEIHTGHPALLGATIVSQRKLAPGQIPVADDHGTAIAALLVGQPGSGYVGLVPRARLLAAAPFYRLPSGHTRADALGLAQSLDWLVAQGAKVIGLSLTGPRNAVLDAALERARAQGVLLVAAAGNEGRRGVPLFPAAHPDVLAVTALTPRQAVYRRANQGEHIRFALPGADLSTVARDGSLQKRSGTSYAVPLLVAMASQSLHERLLSPNQWLRAQGMTLQDLGPSGRDAVFGWGLPRLTPTCR